MNIVDYGAFNSVLLNLDKNQDAFSSIVTELSTGLRVNNAADDPSGYAIASRMQAISSSLNQGTLSIQNAVNLLNVANGATAQVVTILQRMRVLFVEANSDINSTADLADIQTEIDQLTQEINRIAVNTSFNGQSLFNGNLTTEQPNLQNQVIFAVNPNTNGNGANPPEPTGANGGPPLITDVQATPGTDPITVSFTVQSFASSATGNLVTISYTAESANPNDTNFGPASTTTFQVAEGTNYPAGFPGTEPALNDIFNASGSEIYMSFEFNNVNQYDVGETAVWTDVPPQGWTPGNGLSVNTGTDEGSTVLLQVGPLDAYNLGVANLFVGDTQTNQGGEARIDYALQNITTQQANIGAQITALGVAADNNNTYQNNLTASASNITDLDIGQATTQYTKEQILVQVGTSVLSQLESNGKIMTALLIQALIA